jgi:hypothetical protein
MQMLIRCLPAIVALALMLAGPAGAADVSNCLKVVAKTGADASIANGCSQRLNVILCIDGGQGARRCADKRTDVITLFPGASATLTGYDGQAGSAHWAVCVYPEAPVGWDPGPDRPYTCKKTCVMC